MADGSRARTASTVETGGSHGPRYGRFWMDRAEEITTKSNTATSIGTTGGREMSREHAPPPHMSAPWEESIERIADALERQVALQERDEVRRAVKGLLKLRVKYPEEPERTPLRVVR